MDLFRRLRLFPISIIDSTNKYGDDMEYLLYVSRNGSSAPSELCRVDIIGQTIPSYGVLVFYLGFVRADG